MLKNKRLLLIPPMLVLFSMVLLGMRIGYPQHRLFAFILLVLGWIPIVISYRINRRLLRTQRLAVTRRIRPFRAHVIVAILLLVAFYMTWVLFPVKKSPLADMTSEAIRAELGSDLETYRILCNAADDLLAKFREGGLLQRSVVAMSPEDRQEIRARWRDAVMVFVEFDILKEKYRGFYQIDHLAEPALHADAFMLAYMAYTAQYAACMEMRSLTTGNVFIETFLNEPGDGIPLDSFFTMTTRLTHPNVLLRMNVGWQYYKLVGKAVSFDEAVVADSMQRRKVFLKGFGGNSDILIENSLNILERGAFDAMFPLQKNIAVQMSYIRTAKRDYLITPEIVSAYRERIEPGDILLQRRNWHMTNVGIPGFWPHTALYVGTPAEIEAYFCNLGLDPLEQIKTLYPEAYRAMLQSDADGYPMRVMESIRPGVVFQSLETSAHCDYLGVVRPRLEKVEKFNALLAAFSHYGKPYDLNFDFATDNELVCSELIYKAYHAATELSFAPEVFSGRLLLPPNRMAEQIVDRLDGPDAAFTFVLFLDAVEKKQLVKERDATAFKASWTRPKWDLLQK